ncbi:MAG: hypothetical protein QNJ32_27190 [Xenococcaceae cyanobacterium MO_167.B27]|nr:hypothetical protein [Xenococcaceae cyanobacterium MO_167.B27]
MIEIEYIDNKPQVTINKKKIRIYHDSPHGYVRGETDKNIKVAEIGNIKLNTIPENLDITILLEDDHRQNYYFTFLNINKINSNNFSIEIVGCINNGKWDIEYFYSVFETNFKLLLDDSVRANCMYDGAYAEFHITLDINESWQFKNIDNVINFFCNKINFIYTITLQNIVEENKYLSKINCIFCPKIF